MSDPLSADPLGQVERAQALFEKGPVTAVAAFFALAFFVALYLLLRAKDRYQMQQSQLQADQAKETSRLTEKHGAEMAALYTQERDRAVKNEVMMSNFLDMLESVRYIAFEMRRVRHAREKKKRVTDEDEDSEGDDNGQT